MLLRFQPCLPQSLGQLFVLRDFLPVVLEDIVLRNLPVREHLECFMQVILVVGALLEHVVSNGTIFVLLSIYLVVLYEG